MHQLTLHSFRENFLVLQYPGIVNNPICEDDTKMARFVFARDLELNEINRNASTVAEEYIKNNLDRIQQALLLVPLSGNWSGLVII